MVDADGCITQFNQRAAAMWGRAPRLDDPSERFCGSYRLWTDGGEPMPLESAPMAIALRTGETPLTPQLPANLRLTCVYTM